MENNKLYKVVMRFCTPVHLGKKERIYNLTEMFAHSDTLMSGIINAYSLLYGKTATDKLLEDFLCEKPPFELSSTMPYVQNEFFVPKPVGLNLYLYKDKGVIEVEKDKEIKKVKFVREKDLFENFPGRYKVEGSFLLPKDVFEKFHKDKKVLSLGEVKERARVMVDRQSLSSNIYYFSHFEFKEGTGLWFYLRINDEKEEDRIKAAIRLLGDEGLGGDRTCGLGSFKVEFIESRLPENEKGEYYISLSVVNPRNEDEIKSAKYYEILLRSGYIYSKAGLGIKRKAVRVFAEGTVFSGKVCGRVVDVTPQKFSQHRVYCFALAFLVPLPEGVMLIGS